MRPPGPLWGGVLDGISVDLLRQRIIMNLHVIHESSQPPEEHHILIFKDVADFRLFSSIPQPWSYAEITEFHVREEAPGQLVIDMMLWSEDAGITVKAKSAWLDGAEITARNTSETGGAVQV